MLKLIDVVETVKRQVIACDGDCEESFQKGCLPPKDWVSCYPMDSGPNAVGHHFCPECFAEVLSTIAAKKEKP